MPRNREVEMTDKTLKPCPFCHQPVQFRKALHIEDGNVDSIIHAAPSDCPMVVFEDGSVDESILSKWNTRAQSDVRATEPKSDLRERAVSILNGATGGRESWSQWDRDVFDVVDKAADEIASLCAQLEEEEANAARAWSAWENVKEQLASARKALTWIKANSGAHPRNIVKVIEQYEGEAGCPLTDEDGKS